MTRLYGNSYGSKSDFVGYNSKILSHYINSPLAKYRRTKKAPANTCNNKMAYQTEVCVEVVS